MHVTACLIVKNEEIQLGQCLSRLNDFCHEIVIVDTGSTDKSRDIARDYGAILVERAWNENFSQARNAGLEHATGDWILYIDADEYFEARTGNRACLSDQDIIAATVTLRASSILTPYRELRLFRNRPDIRFQSIIHETIRPAVNALRADDDSLRIIDTPFHIEHHGYEGDLTHKHKRNLDMLIRAVIADPDRIYLRHALGECHMGLGNAEAAQKAWRTGLELLRYGPQDSGNALIYADILSLHFAENGLPQHDIDGLLEEALDTHGENPLILWYAARRYLECGRASDAESLLKQVEAMGPNGPQHTTLGYDLRLFGEYSWALLGSCALASQNYPTAANYFAMALASNPGNTEIRSKLQLTNARLLK